MVLQFLKRAFGIQTKEKITTPETEEERLIAFVEYVVQNLVDQPAAVKVRVVENPREFKIEIVCDKADIGKVIGKRGRTVASIRSLASGAARRVGKKVSVEIID